MSQTWVVLDRYRERGDWWRGISHYQSGTKEIEDGADKRLQLVQEIRHSPALVGIGELYAKRELAFYVEVGGKFGQRSLKAPAAHFRVVFEGLPFREPRFDSGQVWQADGSYRTPGWMDKTVLIRDVGVVESFDDAWNAGTAANERRSSPDGLISGVKWLEFADSLALARAHKLDAFRARDLLPELRVIDNREAGAVQFFFCERAALPENRQLDDKVVKRRPEIVECISIDETPILAGGRQLFDVKDVLRSLVVSFSAERVCVVSEDCGDFRPQFIRVSLGPPELSLAGRMAAQRARRAKAQEVEA